MKNNPAKKIKLWLGVWSLGILILGFSAFFLHEIRLPVYPNAPQKILRNDSFDGGGSEISEQDADTSLKLNVRLRSGAPTPYAGVGFVLVSPLEILKENFVDFSKYDSMRVVVATDRMPKVTLRLSVHDPLWTTEANAASARPLDLVIDVTRNFKEYKVPLSDFSVPERWFDMMGIENLDYWRHMERGMRLEVLTASGTMLGIPDAIEIKALELYGINRQLLWILGIAAFGLSVFCFYSIIQLKRKG